MAAEIKYDVKRGADTYRAIYESRLKSWISKGAIKRGDAVVWRSDLSGWRKPEELEELRPFFEQWERKQLRKIGRKRGERKVRLRKKRIKNILMIDDEKDLCLIVTTALTRKGYNVAIANTRRKAIASIKREKPDLILLDLKLPDGDGMTLLPRIKKMTPRTVVNIISAYGSEEIREEARKKGAYTFIDKPFTEKDILKSIKAVS